jgi:hypothetical protein
MTAEQSTAAGLPRLWKWAAPGLMALFSIAYFASVVGRALAKPFWYDEVFTVYNSRLPSLATLMTALQSHGDFSPPVLHLLTRAAAAVPGNELVTLRLPAMIGVWILCLCVYRLVARRLAGRFALAAVFMLMLTPVYDYAFEARGYGIALAVSGVALVCWQAAAEGWHRPLSLAGLAVCAALIPLTHYYYGLVILAIGLAELARAVQRRRPDWPMAAALACSSLGLPIILPQVAANLDGSVIIRIHEDLLALLMTSTQGLFGGLIVPLSVMGSGWLLSFVVPAGARSGRWIRPETVSTATTLAAGLAVMAFSTAPRWTFLGGLAIAGSLAAFRWLPAPESSGSAARTALPEYEVVLYLALVVLVALSVAATAWHGFFSIRYCLFAAIGAAGLMALLFSRLEPQWPAAGLTLAALLALFVMARLSTGWENLRTPAMPAIDPLLAKGPPGLPIAVANNFDFVQLQYRAPQGLRGQLVYLADPEAELRYIFANVADRALLEERRFAPLAVYDYRSFIDTHARFLVYEATEPNWLVPQLQADGYQLQLIDSGSDSWLYQAQARTP